MIDRYDRNANNCGNCMIMVIFTWTVKVMDIWMNLTLMDALDELVERNKHDVIFFYVITREYGLAYGIGLDDRPTCR